MVGGWLPTLHPVDFAPPIGFIARIPAGRQEMKHDDAPRAATVRADHGGRGR